MTKNEFKCYFQGEQGRYSSTWTISTIGNNVFVTTPTVGGTSVSAMLSTGLCQFLFTPLSKEFALFAHIPPCPVDSWLKLEVESGLFKLLDIHMPHNLLAENPLYGPADGRRLTIDPGYDVTSIALFESLLYVPGWKYFSSADYQWLHTMKLPNGRFLYIMTYGNFLEFPQYPRGEEAYFAHSNRLVASHISQGEEVGYLVDAMLNLNALGNIMQELDGLIHKFGG